MATTTERNLAEMFAHTLFEVSGCLERLGYALLSSSEGGQLPARPGKSGRAARAKATKKPRKQKDGKRRRTRKPSTYNLFMKKTMQELKQNGFTSTESNGLFKAAIDEWKDMDADAKQAWTDAHAEELAAYGKALAAARATSEGLPLEGAEDDLAKELTPIDEETAEDQVPEGSPAAPTPAAEAPIPEATAADASVPEADADKPKKKKKKRHHDKEGHVDIVDGEKKRRKKHKKSKGDLQQMPQTA